MTRQSHSYLALGDSYTIGEGLPLFDSFPYQTVQLLRNQGFHFNAPEIIAKTGWATFELAKKLRHTTLQAPYDFVTLLIGVNNQYRNLLPAKYQNEFKFLLKKAIHLSADKPTHVVVLSIPDYSVTPFAFTRNPQKISGEIDQFNRVNMALTKKCGANYIDITTSSRQAANDLSLITDDTLHPSAKEYAKWAALLAIKLAPLILVRG